MSHWNHRVIHKHHQQTDDHTYQVHEVYYDDNGNIDKWTISPVSPMGETPYELREEIKYFIKAFQKPILIEISKDGKDELIPDSEEPEINNGHYFELLDRTWVAIDYIYQFLGSHPVMAKEESLHKIYLKAEESLSALYQEIGKLEFELNSKKS